MLWLIDLLLTREAHSIDFATWAGFAHVITPQIAEPRAFLELFRQPETGPLPTWALLTVLRQVAGVACSTLSANRIRTLWRPACKRSNIQTWTPRKHLFA
jgi:hypothetical protein